MSKTNAIPGNPFTHADGATILAAVKAGKRNKDAYFAACDEVDRRVTNRVAASKAITRPIAEALTILDKRGIAHAGPVATEIDVLAHREKDVDVKAPKAPKAPKVDDEATIARKAALAAADKQAAKLAEINGGGFVKLRIQARKEALAALTA